jgi:superfamily II DNA or RNA helicase
MDLKPHQKFVVDYMKKSDQKGIIIYHGLGSGKTITAISIANLYNENVICIVPASMRTQWVLEINKTKSNLNKFNIMSYERFNKEIMKEPLLLNDKIVIIDEAHRIRNITSQKSYYMEKYAENAKKIILLTGTIMVNSPHDIGVLVNIIKKRNFMPTNEEHFNNEFKIIAEFKNRVKCLFSYYMPNNLDDYPEINKIIKNIPMSGKQLELYIKLSNNLSQQERDMINHGNLLIRNKHFNSFLNITRQLSNIVKNEETSRKLEQIIKYCKLGPKPSIVYSNWLESGIYPMAKLLEKNNIRFLQFTGELNDKQKRNVVELYNNRKIDVLLLSSSGGEGLDLKNTRQIHIMEPHWNIAKINQVIGRGRRYKSHEYLPKNEKIVDVFFWVSTIKNEMSVDQYLYRISKNKQNLMKIFNDAIINSSIEQEICQKN